MPYDGECLYVLKLENTQYRNYLIVDAKDSLLVYKNTMGDGEYYRLTPNVGFGYNKDRAELQALLGCPTPPV